MVTAMAKDKLTNISADNVYITYAGRIDFSNKKLPTFSYPGVTIKAKFKGSKIGFVLIEHGTGEIKTTNGFEIIIDDTLISTLHLQPGRNKYLHTNALPYGEHAITLFKRTESEVGKCSFEGFLIEEVDLLLITNLKTRNIEIIGDSWSCAYGNERAENPPKSGFDSKNENNYMAWGAILSREFNVNYMCTAYSGRGLYRNGGGSTHGTLPLIYNRIFPNEESPVWNHQNYKPDLILIHLGSNDFMLEAQTPPQMIDATKYVNTYIAFVKELKTIHPQATVIMAFGNSKSDWWPVGLKSLTRWRSFMKEIQQTLEKEGLKNVFEFELSTQKAPYGEDWHPAIHTHKKIAEELKPFVAEKMGW